MTRWHCSFFGGLFLYFVAGAIYMKVRDTFKHDIDQSRASFVQQAKAAAGSDLIIHKQFWFSLPGYVKACIYEAAIDCNVKAS